MAKFVVETKQTSRFTYEVDAPSVDEAMKKVERGVFEPTDECHGPEEVTHTYERRVVE